MNLFRTNSGVKILMWICYLKFFPIRGKFLNSNEPFCFAFSSFSSGVNLSEKIEFRFLWKKLVFFFLSGSLAYPLSETDSLVDESDWTRNVMYFDGKYWNLLYLGFVDDDRYRWWFYILRIRMNRKNGKNLERVLICIRKLKIRFSTKWKMYTKTEFIIIITFSTTFRAENVGDFWIGWSTHLSTI